MRSRALQAIPLLIATIALSVTIYARVGYPSESGLIPQISLIMGAIGVLFATGFLVASRQRDVREIPLRVSLAGPSRAGKTVYANLSSILLTEVGLDSLEFTASSRTIQRTSRLIQGLNEGEWPSSTTNEGLTLYQGVMARRRRPVAQLLTGRTEIDVELADAGGDLWDSLAEPGSTWPGTGRDSKDLDLRNSTLFEYAANSHALFFFIPADMLLSDAEMVKLQVDHLTSLIALLLDSQRRAPKSRQISYAVVISKCDLLSVDEFDMLRALIDSRREFSMTYTSRDLGVNPSPTFSASVLQLERYLAFASRREIRTRVFAISAVGSAMAQGVLVDREVEALGLDRQQLGRAQYELRHLMDTETALRPLDWAVRNSLLA